MSQPNSSFAPQLVDNSGETIPDGWTLLADEDTTGVDGPYILPFERALRELDGLNGHYGVRINPADDVRLLEPFMTKIILVEVAFPGFRDGRGYSAARILREAGYEGELRAQGDILLDQVIDYRRCGFDALASESPLDPQAVEEALARFPHFYQRAADDRAPVWKLRHG